MRRINFCIVLYNKDISESKAISDLKNHFEKNDFLGCIVIFNNGPNSVMTPKEDYIKLNQILINGSLSKIYNKFISEYPADLYVFLDDDTSVTKNYLDELNSIETTILMPKISCKGKIHYPFIVRNKVQTITSGLVISSKVVSKLQNIKSFVFDERFDLYGVDTAFCHVINDLELPYKISVSVLSHDLSHISSGSNEFRSVEVLLANSASLIPYFSLRLFSIVVFWQFKMLLKLKICVFFSSIVSIFLKRTIRLWRY